MATEDIEVRKRTLVKLKRFRRKGESWNTAILRLIRLYKSEVKGGH